jgi:hypothetical protein
VEPTHTSAQQSCVNRLTLWWRITRWSARRRIERKCFATNRGLRACIRSTGSQPLVPMLARMASLLRSALLAGWTVSLAAWPSLAMPSAAGHHHSEESRRSPDSHQSPCPRCCDLGCSSCAVALVRPHVTVSAAQPAPFIHSDPRDSEDRLADQRSYPRSPLPLGPPTSLP